MQLGNIRTLNPPRMLTIREAAQAGPLTEYALRLLLKQERLPGVFIGSKFLVNYDRFISQLNGESLVQMQSEMNGQ